MVVRQPQRFTVEDYLALPGDGRRFELIHGELIDVSPSPTEPHQRFVGRLYLKLGLHVESRRLGAVYPAPLDVFLSPEDVFEPDRLCLSTSPARASG